MTKGAVINGRRVHGRIGISSTHHDVKRIWYSRDEEMDPLPFVSMEDVNERDAVDISFDDTMQMSEMKRILKWLLSSDRSPLSYRLRYILNLRYMHGMTLEEAGASTRMTKERVRQLEAKAFRRLKWFFHEWRLS